MDTTRIPVGQVIYDLSLVRCSVSSKPEDIGKEISDSFGRFAKGDIAAGLQSVVSNGIKALLGSFQGNKSDHKF